MGIMVKKKLYVGCVCVCEWGSMQSHEFSLNAAKM